MLTRPQAGTRAVLVSLDFGEADYQDSLSELVLLAHSAGITPCATVEGKRARPDPAYFAGSGKVEEIAAAAAASEADLVIFNHPLSPAQERNLEQKIMRRVIDRTTLILDIFACRAQSHEGKLQVELAQLEHLATRLVRGWTHLERQKGGIGLRGPGETQLETDRRLLGKRVKLLKDRLASLQRQRDVRRRARARQQVFSLSLVGYTNAGKSTLFNRLTGEGSYAADQLFATLDTTTRRIFVPNAGDVVISDTVGFIRHLPHTLVAAFRATLEETIRADVLLHVVDANHPNRVRQIDEVNKVLFEIGADHIRPILIMNKIDAGQQAARVERDEYGKINAIYLSARTGDGVSLLRDALGELADDTANTLPTLSHNDIRFSGTAGNSPCR